MSLERPTIDVDTPPNASSNDTEYVHNHVSIERLTAASRNLLIETDRLNVNCTREYGVQSST